MKVTESQIQFFEQLLGEKDFGDQDLGELLEQFKQLDKRSASKWIERAMELPKLDTTDVPIVNPTF